MYNVRSLLQVFPPQARLLSPLGMKIRKKIRHLAVTIIVFLVALKTGDPHKDYE